MKKQIHQAIDDIVENFDLLMTFNTSDIAGEYMKEILRWNYYSFIQGKSGQEREQLQKQYLSSLAETINKMKGQYHILTPRNQKHDD